jgi:non-ribosomal peptide synthetase component F
VNWIEIPDSESGVLYLDIPLELVSRITKKAKALHTTGFVIQLSTFAEVLCQYLAVPEIIIGTAAITRFHPDLEKIVACLTNLVPLKIARGKNLENSCRCFTSRTKSESQPISSNCFWD